MNVCLIAACVANSIARRKKEEKTKSAVEELYYKVTLKKYYYFKRATIICPTELAHYPVLNDEVIPVIEITPVVLGARTFAIAASFSVKESLCPKGIDKYIKDNIDRITATTEWEARHTKVLTDYCSAVKQEYDIDIGPAQLDYTTEYYWEVK